MGQYFSDIVNEEADDQLEMDIISTVPGRYGDSYVCRVSDGDKDVGFILQSRAMKYVFVSEGELTVNFVKLLARLFKKDFEAGNALGLGGADVVLPQHVQHGGAGQSGDVGHGVQRQGDHRQDQARGRGAVGRQPA